MAKQGMRFLAFSILCALLHLGVGEEERREETKLFVFGDSYADGGNLPKAWSPSWKAPYGITFPGKPSGRFSDGGNMADFVALHLGIRSPIAYKWSKSNPERLRYGMNFANGGTGVFNTSTPAPNLTTQIDQLQNMINDGKFTYKDINQSIALVSVCGNDYGTYFARNGTGEHVEAFITSLIDRLALNLKQLQELGMRKIVVTAIEPLGCLPGIPVGPHLHCNETRNEIFIFHNLALEKAVQQLNKQTIGTGMTIATIDLFNAMMSIFRGQQDKGKWTFADPLRPCCQGIGPTYKCGDVDSNGAKMYTVCDNPSNSFFWDSVHPSQAGWASISSYLGKALDMLL